MHNCPICNGILEEKTVAPCFDCGYDSTELEELGKGEHEYFLYRIFELELVLCDFCDADFGSYYPEYFGLKGEFPKGQNYDLQRMGQVKTPSISRDLYCKECKHRLAFLDFLKNARINNNT